MTFEEYKATKRQARVEDPSSERMIEAYIYGECDEGHEGIIEICNHERGKYSLVIFNQDYLQDDLEGLEKILWDDYAQFNYED